MIEWAVLRMMQAYQTERKAWQKIKMHAGAVTVADMNRIVTPSAAASSGTFKRMDFASESTADFFIEYRAFEAALMSVLKFWRKM